MRKTKSIDDISAQMDRLMNDANISSSRSQRVFNTAQRYIKNIQKQKAYTDKEQESNVAFYTKYSRWNEIRKERNSRQYSRRQYMGLSNG